MASVGRSSVATGRAIELLCVPRVSWASTDNVWAPWDQFGGVWASGQVRICYKMLLNIIKCYKINREEIQHVPTPEYLDGRPQRLARLLPDRAI